MQKHDSAAPRSTSHPAAFATAVLSDLKRDAAGGAKVTTFRPKVTPTSSPCSAFSLAKVTKVAPAGDSRDKVQLAHFHVFALSDCRATFETNEGVS